MPELAAPENLPAVSFHELDHTFRIGRRDSVRDRVEDQPLALIPLAGARVVLCNLSASAVLEPAAQKLGKKPVVAKPLPPAVERDDKEVGLETDTKRLKVGDNLTNWNDLDYYISTLPSPLPAHTVVNVPNASDYTGAMVYITDEAGGAVVAFSDGTNWRRVTDREIIS